MDDQRKQFLQPTYHHYPPQPSSPLSDHVEPAPMGWNDQGYSSGSGKELTTVQYEPPYEPTVLIPQRRRGWSTWWWKEIVAIISSFIFQGAAIVILICMSDKPYTRWNFFVSLNATIAIFTTAAKATLLLSVTACISQWKWLHFKSRHHPLRDFDVYDEASRGSLGSLFLLTSLRWGVPAVGAIVTILALGIDAFAQQVVTMESRDVFGVTPNVSATFSFSRNYTSGAKSDGFGVENTIKSTIDTAMQGSIFRGLYNLETASLFTCASSCKWPGPYTTLGFQTTCTNVTVDTAKTKKCTAKNAAARQDCNMTTPNGVFISTAWNPTQAQTIIVVNSTTTPPIPVGSRPNVNVKVQSNVTQFAVLRAPSNFNEGGSRGIIGEEVVECVLKLGGFVYSDVEAVGNSLTIKSTEPVLLDSGYYTTNSSNNASILLTDGTHGDFGISPPDMMTLFRFFTSPQFIGEMQDGVSESKGEGVAGAFINGTVSDVAAKMAASMTDHVRSGDNREFGYGLMSGSVVFVRVQWEWLSLPLAAELAAAILLIVTMRESNRNRGVSLWKSSNAALLYHYLTSPDGILRTDVQGPEQLYGLRDAVKVKLQ